jgi:hypothetical protein
VIATDLLLGVTVCWTAVWSLDLMLSTVSGRDTVESVTERDEESESWPPA